MWRRGRDSNPRDGSPPTPLAGARLRPLGHLSKAAVTGFAPGGQGRAGRARVEYGRNRHMVVAAAAERGRIQRCRSTPWTSRGCSSPSPSPFHIIFPGLLDRARELSRGAELPAPAHRRRGLPPLFDYWKTIFAVAFGMGVVSGHRHVLPVRHQLVGLLRPGGPGGRAADGLRGAVGLLPRGGFPRRHALRPRQGRPGPALPRDADGRGRHARLGVLDPQRQLLDADAGRLRRSTPPASSCPRTGGRSIFNPSFPYRLVHMVLAAYLTTALVVGAVGAWHLLRDATEHRGARGCSRWRWA